MTNYFLFSGDSGTGAFMKEEDSGYGFYFFFIYFFPHRGKWMGEKTLFAPATGPAFQMHFGDSVLFIKCK